METLYPTIYRPPTEHRSALLEISVGCSWGKCIFCRLSSGDIPLQVIPQKTLERNLLEMVVRGESRRRMFLTGENALAFKTNYLLDIFSLVRSYLPSIEKFALYGRVDDIENKTDNQLVALKNAGLATIYMGVESGNAEVLRRTCKCATPEQMLTQLTRLDRAEINYGLSSILGLGGEDLSERHAMDTACFYNKVRPSSVRLLTLTPMPGSPLETQIQNGHFRLLDPLQVLVEEHMLIDALKPISRYRLVANHISNNLPFTGNMPEDKTRLLSALDDAIASPAIQKNMIDKW